MTRPFRLSRRAALRGLGTLAALPLLEAMLPRARATDPPPPVRTVFFYVPNGMIMDRFRPTGEGASYELSSHLASLAPYKADVLVVSGLHNRVAYQSGGQFHANCTGGLLTGRALHVFNEGDTSPLDNGVSADQALAQVIGASTRFSSLVLGSESEYHACDDTSCAYSWNISWTSASTPAARDVYPRSVFDRLFAGDDPAVSGEEAMRRRALDRSVLDYVKADAARLHARLGATDRMRLDEHLTGVRELEKRLDTTLSPACTDLAVQTAGAFDAEHFDYPAHVRAMCDLMALALECDQTRVISYMMAFGASARSQPPLGIYEAHHWLSHHNGDPAMIDKVATIERWEIEQFAYLVGKLRGIPEGEGTLLDSCQVVLCNEMGDSNVHQPWDLPVVVAGRAGGAVSPGRHLVFPDEAPFSNLLISLLGNAGHTIASFGAEGTGPLAGLDG
jgi:hypothetical protein